MSAEGPNPPQWFSWWYDNEGLKHARKGLKLLLAIDKAKPDSRKHELMDELVGNERAMYDVRCALAIDGRQHIAKPLLARLDPWWADYLLSKLRQLWNAEWHVHARHRATVSMVAPDLGLERRGGSWAPCPACGATVRNTGPRGPVVVSDAGAAWRCLSCGTRGGVLDLIALVLTGNRDPLGDTVRSWCEQRGLCA